MGVAKSRNRRKVLLAVRGKQTHRSGEDGEKAEEQSTGQLEKERKGLEGNQENLIKGQGSKEMEAGNKNGIQCIV